MTYRNYLLILLLFLLTLGERVLFDFGPNIELVTVSMLLVAFYFGAEKSLWFTLFVMLASDLFLGNTSIFLFTWSGFLIPVVVSGKIFQKKRTKNIEQSGGMFSRVFLGTGLGISTTLFFFLWTNFGVWALDSWGMYSNDLSGLMMSYINALPFLKNHLISTLVFVPTGFGVIEGIKSLRLDIPNLFKSVSIIKSSD